jgi:hypothetical protein
MRVVRSSLPTTFFALILVAGVADMATAHGSSDERKGFQEHQSEQFSAGPPSALVADNFDVLGHVNLGGGSPNGDIFFFDHGGDVGKFAYVGTWSSPCSGHGIKIVDVNDPGHPKLVARAGGRTGISNEDVVVTEIGGMDVLGIGVQLCKPQGGSGGLQLFDVTDPTEPQALSFLSVPGGGVHELDMVTRSDGTSLALLAVPFTEFDDTYFGTDSGGEFRIVDITDPAAPVEVADWGAIADSALRNFGGGQEVSSSFQGLGYFAAHYAHSVRAEDGGMTAYVSYWDSGVLKFDISDPSSPALLGRTQFGVRDDGDAHSMTPYDVGGTRYILQNDEDFSSLSPAVVTSSATGATEYSGIEEPWAPTLLSELGTVGGTIHDANDGCEASDFTGAAGDIALADTYDPFYVGIIPGWTRLCTIGSQVLRAADAGADGVLFNLISPDDAWTFFEGSAKAVQQAAGGMAIVQVSDIDGLADAIRATAGPDTVTLDPSPPSWGFIRVFSESSSSDVNGDGTPEFAQVGSFDDLDHTSGELFTPPGSWSVHNTEVNGDHAYSAWYSHGIVALDLTNPAAPTMVGQFVPPTSDRFAGSLGHGPAEVWGVAIDPETGIVYASDMRTGLWIVEPTGPAAA